MSENLTKIGAAARAVAQLGRSVGNPFPYFWLFPPRNARPVMESGILPITGAAGDTEIAAYTVSEGFRFFFTGLVFEVIDPAGWIEGSGSLVLSLSVSSTAGIERPVQFFNNVTFQLGSRITGPFYFPRSLEFHNSNIITATLTETGAVASGPIVFVYLVGYEIPESEASS